MLSDLTLKIKGEDLTNEYFIKRNKEILPMSIAVVSQQIAVHLIVAIVSIIKNWNEYILQLWLGRIIGTCLNIILVYVGYRYPRQTAPYHGALLVLNQICLLLWKSDISLDEFPKAAIPNSIAGVCMTMIYSIVTNGNWILNSISITIVTVVVMTFYSIMYEYVDSVTYALLGNIIIFTTIALYKIEKKDKMEFLAYQ